MAKRLVAGRFAVVALLCAAPLTAQQVVDQYYDPGVYNFIYGARVAQSFTPSADNISGAGIRFRSYDPVTYFIMSIWESAPFPTTGTKLIEQRVDVTGANVPLGMMVDAFWDPISITPGATYFLMAQLDGAGVVFGYDPCAAYPDQPYHHGEWPVCYADYPGGDFYQVVGDSTNRHLYKFSEYPGHGVDAAFETFATTSTPEPATVTLTATGLAGVWAARRRRKTAERLSE